VVTHDEREIEFVDLKKRLDQFILGELMDGHTDQRSCETWAGRIGDHFGAKRCEVSEDAENGAVVEWRDWQPVQRIG
jgi:hypothetical protein